MVNMNIFATKKLMLNQKFISYEKKIIFICLLNCVCYCFFLLR